MNTQLITSQGNLHVIETLDLHLKRDLTDVERALSLAAQKQHDRIVELVDEVAELELTLDYQKERAKYRARRELFSEIDGAMEEADSLKELKEMLQEIMR